MKYFFFALCFATPFVTTAYQYAEPFLQTQTTQKPEIKEVTKAEFLKQLTAIDQSAKNETLTVSFVPKEKDPTSVVYDGTNHTDIEKSLSRMATGDKIIIESQPESLIQTRTYILK